MMTPNKEIGPNFTYPVSRGLETGLAAPKVPHLIFTPFKKIFSHSFLHLSKKTNCLVPQVLKQVVNLSCLIYHIQRRIRNLVIHYNTLGFYAFRKNEGLKNLKKKNFRNMVRFQLSFCRFLPNSGMKKKFLTNYDVVCRKLNTRNYTLVYKTNKNKSKTSQ